MDLSKQYNKIADDYTELNTSDIGNRVNRELFYSHIDFIHPGTKVLDVACGDGLDLEHYQTMGAELYGVDASEEMIAKARERLPGANVRVGLFEQIPFEDNYFDAVVSKYAIMTSADVAPVFKEIHRVLKPGGIMMYLVTHPFRQYFEKKNPQSDYFKQEIVQSRVFQEKVSFTEPTHTMNDYLNEFLFKHFDVQLFEEAWDPAAEQIDGRKYPCFFILKAKKR